MLGNEEEDSQNLAEKRKNQKTRDVTVHRSDQEEPEELKDVQMIHDGVEGWTLFELDGGEQCWRQDSFLVGYDDPEGTY